MNVCRRSIFFWALISLCPSFALSEEIVYSNEGAMPLSEYQNLQQSKMEAACKKKRGSDQYWQECILDRIPGARNEIAIAEGKEYCDRKAPCAWPKTKRGWIFGVTAANECFEKYGKRTSLKSAAYYIRSACYDLYEDR